MGYRSVVSNPELEIDLTGSRITHEAWEEIDREVIQGGLGENLEFRTWFTRGDKGKRSSPAWRWSRATSSPTRPTTSWSRWVACVSSS